MLDVPQEFFARTNNSASVCAGGLGLRFKCALLMLLLSACSLLSESAHALGCPTTQPGATLQPVTQDGFSFYNEATLYDQQLNADGTALLCRYSGQVYAQSNYGGAAAVPAGTYRFDRMAESPTHYDPANSWVVKLLNANHEYWCDGAAIAPDWVLTARSCGDGVGPGTPVVVGPRTPIETCWYVSGGWGKPPKRVCATAPPVTTTVAWPYEYLTSAGQFKGDLVLLKLTHPVVLSEYGVPAFARLDFDSAQTGCAKGAPPCTYWSGVDLTWADTTGNVDSYRRPAETNALSAAKVKFHRNAACNFSYLDLSFLDPGLCTLANDSAARGSPLVYNDLIVGIWQAQFWEGAADVANGKAGAWIMNTVASELQRRIPRPQ